jgi:hypothetical protein
MVSRKERSGKSGDYTVDFPAVLQQWLREHDAVVGGLAGLRNLGPRAEPALDAVLNVWVVKKTQLSWQLWEYLVLDAGDDPDVLLLATIPRSELEHARFAFWGASTSHGKRLRVVK